MRTFLHLCFLQYKLKTNKGLAQTPSMGWNSWKWFGKNFISEELIREVADTMAEHKLNEYGYEYLVVDGGARGNGKV